MRIGFPNQVGCWGSAHNMVTKSACFECICNFQNLRFNVNLRWKISVAKFRDPKLWVDSFKGFSFSFLIVCSFFFSRCCFHEDICETKLALLQFLEKNWKKPLSSGKFLPLKSFHEFFLSAHHPPLSERNVLLSKTLIRDPRWQFQD